jgi:uncharacterized protein YdeI (YjbR/CyaY-like superfamily)
MLTDLIRKAMELTDQGVQKVRKVAARDPVTVPDDLRAAIDAEPAAASEFESFSPSAQREYADWITGAKRPATRMRRITQAVAWIAEGKKRNWKYEAKSS